MTAAPLVIRRATAADWDSIWPIFAAVVSVGDTYMYAPETSEPEARHLWMSPDVATYVAELEGIVVGTYILRINHGGPGSHVANAGYMVRPDAFGRGIATAMCEHSLAEARAAGFRAMQFNAVISTNVRAVALWQRLGFAIVGTVPEAFRHPELGYVGVHVMYRRL